MVDQLLHARWRHCGRSWQIWELLHQQATSWLRRRRWRWPNSNQVSLGKRLLKWSCVQNGESQLILCRRSRNFNSKVQTGCRCKRNNSVWHNHGSDMRNASFWFEIGYRLLRPSPNVPLNRTATLMWPWSPDFPQLHRTSQRRHRRRPLQRIYANGPRTIKGCGRWARQKPRGSDEEARSNQE